MTQYNFDNARVNGALQLDISGLKHSAPELVIYLPFQVMFFLTTSHIFINEIALPDKCLPQKWSYWIQNKVSKMILVQGGQRTARWCHLSGPWSSIFNIIALYAVFPIKSHFKILFA